MSTEDLTWKIIAISFVNSVYSQPKLATPVWINPQIFQRLVHNKDSVSAECITRVIGYLQTNHPICEIELERFKIFVPGIWLAGSTIDSRLKAVLENTY